MSEEKQTFNVTAAANAQKKYCEENNLPRFAPYDGVCFSCHKNIYVQIESHGSKSGYSVERAASRLITGCPHCCASYCD